MKKTLVLGASLKTERYSNKAIRELIKTNHPVVAIGNREGKLMDVDIQKGFPSFNDIDTVTLYLNQKNQATYLDYILEEIRPKRIIFNPGTEHLDFAQKAKEQGIEVVYGCTLVMLATNQY